MLQRDPLYKTAQALKKLSNRTRKMTPLGAAIPGTFPLVTVTADYTISDIDYTVIVDASGAPFEVFLPTAVSAFSEGAGRVFVVKRINSGLNSVDVTADGSETIDGSVTVTLSTQYQYIVIQSDGANWHIIANN